MQKGKINKFFSFLSNNPKNFISLRRISKKLNPTHFLLVGSFLMLFGGIYHLHDLAKLSFEGQKDVIEYKIGEAKPPVKITIPSVEIELPIEPATIKNGIWQISSIGVSHLISSKSPGETGNIILYGHNTFDKLGRLSKVKIGNIINLKTSDRRSYAYKISTIEVVDPTQIDELNRFEGEMITIYTCTGFADLKRLLVKAQRFDPVSQLQ